MRRSPIVDGPPEEWRVDSAVGDLRRWRQVDLPGLGRTADLVVWLPPEVTADAGRETAAATTAGFPAVYFCDGHNLFDGESSYAGAIWRADRAGAFLAERGLPVILVGVPCSPTQRAQEYTPFPSPAGEGGGAESYLQFLVEHLKPAVDRWLPTAPAPANTLVAGSSLGGVFAAWAWAQRPDVFGGAGVFSPAFHWDRGRSLAHLEAVLPLADISEDDERGDRLGAERGEGHTGTAHRRLYVDVGGREAPDHEPVQRAYVRDALHLARIVDEAAIPVSLRYDSPAGHHEAAWAARLPFALDWLLRGYRT